LTTTKLFNMGAEFVFGVALASMIFVICCLAGIVCFVISLICHIPVCGVITALFGYDLLRRRWDAQSRNSDAQLLRSPGQNTDGYTVVSPAEVRISSDARNFDGSESDEFALAEAYLMPPLASAPPMPAFDDAGNEKSRLDASLSSSAPFPMDTVQFNPAAHRAAHGDFEPESSAGTEASMGMLDVGLFRGEHMPPN
jgi:hypothetical protein